jgi:hypothetical protein
LSFGIPQGLARCVAIAADLGREFVHGGEMRLVTQLFHELEGYSAPVEVAREIEEERFESRRAAMLHGRVGSEARHSLESASCHAETFYRKDPRDSRLRPREAHVCGRESHAAPALPSVDDATADDVGPPQQSCRFRKIRGRKRLAHARAGHACPIQHHRRQHLHVEAQPRARRLEARYVAAPPRAIAKVLAHQDPARRIVPR